MAERKRSGISTLALTVRLLNVISSKPEPQRSFLAAAATLQRLTSVLNIRVLDCVLV